MLTQARDYYEECTALDALVREAGEHELARVTQFKGWTFEDVIGHLYLFDHAAWLTLSDPPGFAVLLAEVTSSLRRRENLREFARRWLGQCGGRELLSRWRACYVRVAEAYAAADPGRRVSWFGPDMSARSSISARQMETWAHGQSLFDVLGRERVETDRIRNIVVMGVNTFAWTFTNRRLEVPPLKPYVHLYAPSGAIWSWNEPSEDERVEGSAVEFCRVVTQTRNVADTALEVRGGVATAWMSTAQCFAGPPEQPPVPGTRRMIPIEPAS